MSDPNKEQGDGEEHQVDTLGMSDEAFENFSFDDIKDDTPAADPDDAAADEAAKAAEAAAAEADKAAGSDADDDDIEDPDDKNEGDPSAEDAGDPGVDGKKADDKEAAKDAGEGNADAGKADAEAADANEDKDYKEDKGKDTDTKDKDKSEIDYKAEYEKILTPFRANNKDIKVDSVDDAITLMKMGANYNKKMHALKPNLKLIKMLENNDLLDESRLSHLIDLDKKNPEAIKKLIKDSGINPLDIDVKQDTEYTPNTYTVDDKEVELDSVLSEIKDSPKFKDTINVISNKWDEPSKKVLVDSPSIIRVIHEHMELGIYDKISEVVERERMLGRLTGLSDIQAYKQVGDAINANGGFDESTDSNTVKPDAKPAEKKPVDTQRKDRKKAASHTKSAAVKGVGDVKDVLSLSDEAFENLPSSKYM